MALPVTIPNAFANATASIPLSQLDTNFNTLANAVNGISDGSETLANVTATVGNITTVNATTVDTTDIEVTNIKAKDGTAAIAIADSTGVTTQSTPAIISVDSSSDALRITQEGAGAALRVEDSANPDGTPFVVDADGKVLTYGNQIGYVQNSTVLPVATSVSSIGLLSWNGNGSGQLTLGQQVTSSAPPIVGFYKSRGGNTATPTVVSSGDITGSLRFYGHDGTGFIDNARISAAVDGTPGTNDMPGRIVFETTAAAASTTTERMRITSAGEVLVGGTTEIGNNFGCLTLIGTGNTSNVLSFFRDDTAVISPNNLGALRFYGNDTTSNTPTELAYIEAKVSGTHGAGDNPTDIVFGTTPDGSDTVAEVARFTESKYLRFASGTGGIQFGGDTASANALNDYEEGTFTPTLYGLTTAGTPTYTAQNGKYTKIGNVVIFNLLITLSNKGGMVGSLRIGDLPFTDVSDNINAAVSIGNMSGMTITAGETVMGRVINNASYMSLFLTDAVSGNTNLQDTEIGDTFSIDVAGSYFVS